MSNDRSPPGDDSRTIGTRDDVTGAGGAGGEYEEAKEEADMNCLQVAGRARRPKQTCRKDEEAAALDVIADRATAKGIIIDDDDRGW